MIEICVVPSNIRTGWWSIKVGTNWLGFSGQPTTCEDQALCFATKEEASLRAADEKWRQRDAQKNAERLRVLQDREKALRSAVRRITGESS